MSSMGGAGNENVCQTAAVGNSLLTFEAVPCADEPEGSQEVCVQYQR